MSEERKIRNIAEYLKEILEIKDQWRNSILAFRGQENNEWPLASSAERRLHASSADQDGVTTRLFIEYHQSLLTRCKLKNYHQREGKPLEELELLADLQHHGAATCLLDFTRNALVALWFACEKLDAEGKVFVVNTADETAFLEITLPDIENRSISDILEFRTRETGKEQAAEPPKRETVATSLNEPNFWYWSPAHLNERITAQHSLFLFGPPSSGELRTEKIAIESVGKEQIRQELKELHDIHEESLFPDFFGFAYTQRHNAPYYVSSAREYLRRGIEAEQRGQHLETIESYTRAIELKPNAEEAYLMRGLAYERQGEHGQAIQDLTRAIDLGLDDATAAAYAYYFRGLAYHDRGDTGLAIQDFTAAVKLKPDFAYSYFSRAGAYGSQDKHDLAIPDLTKAIKQKPDFVNAYYNRGIAYGSRGYVDRAIEDYTTAVELEPDFAAAYYNRGEAWLYLGEWEKAKSDLTIAKNMGTDIIALFHVIYKDIAELEQKIGVKLPEDIVAMLTEKPK